MLNTIELGKLNREICLKAIPYLLKEVEFEFNEGEFHKVNLMGVDLNNNMVLVNTYWQWPGRRDGASALRLEPIEEDKYIRCGGELELLAGDGESGEGMAEPFYCRCKKCGEERFYSVDQSNIGCKMIIS